MKRLTLSSMAMFLIGLTVLTGGCSDDSNEQVLTGQAGWIAGSPVDGYGTILHTQDGGNTWVRQGSQEMIHDVQLNDVTAVDSMNIWVVGQSSNGYATILRTTDGGETWIRQGSASTIPDVDVGLLGVSAVDGEVAWVAGGNGTVLNTIDGGDTWVQQAQGLVPDAQFQSLSAHDRNNVWAVGSVDNNSTICIIHTTDGGKTWVREGESDIPPDARFNALIDVHTIDKSTAWAVGNKGSVFITTDGGTTWVNKSWTDDRACCGAELTDYNGVCAVNDLIAWKALDPAGVCITTDGGDSWIRQERAPSYASGYECYGVTAMDENTAWIVGGNPWGDPGLILHTTDGGKTPWQEQINPVNSNFLRRVSFVGDLRK